MAVKKVCKECGASMMEHRHTLSKAMAEGLRRISEKSPTNLKHLGLTRNQWDNFQKLRYWGLVEKHIRDDGKRIGGAWKITPLGRAFLSGEVIVPKTVWTYRGEFVRHESEGVDIKSLLDGYKTRPEYAEEAVPHKNMRVYYD